MHVPAEHHGPGHEPVADLNAREVAALAPLLVLCLVLGLFPQPLLNLIRPDVEAIAKLYGNVRATNPNILLHASLNNRAPQKNLPSVALGSEVRP